MEFQEKAKLCIKESFTIQDTWDAPRYGKYKQTNKANKEIKTSIENDHGGKKPDKPLASKETIQERKLKKIETKELATQEIDIKSAINKTFLFKVTTKQQ